MMPSIAPARSIQRRPAAEQSVIGSAPTTWPVTLLLVSFAIPWLVQVGPVTLSVYRIILLALVIPCIFAWATGRAGRIRIADIALLLFCLWCTLGLWLIHGDAVALEAGGVQFLETFAAYLIARCYIRSAGQFLHMIRVAFAIIACLLPFAIIESVTGYNLGRSLFAAILPTYQPDAANDMRAGLTRAMVVLEHPILFGLFTGCMLALVHIALGRGKSLAGRWLRSGIVFAATIFSLSSAPIGGLFLQVILIGWNWLLGSYAQLRWKILWAMAALSYIVIDLASSQNPIQFYISRFTFNQQTAWYRFLIWDYGIASIGAFPLFGVGFGEWARPSFMSPSVDNFWLILPLRHGLPAGLLMYLAFCSIYLSVSFTRQPDDERDQYKTAYLITLTALLMIGWSVHFWGPPYVLLMVLMGSGVWFLEKEPQEHEIAAMPTATHPEGPQRGGAAIITRRLPRRAAAAGSGNRRIRRRPQTAEAQ